MTLRCTILGCGSSGGVPRVGNDWGACDPSNPKNVRMRCSVLFERIDGDKRTTLLVDTGPDLRAQMLAVNLRRADAVLYTHDHADHTHGIDDLRFLAYRMRGRVEVWLDARTRANVTRRFEYCFAGGGQTDYPPILTANTIDAPTPFVVTGPAGPVQVTPVPQEHGKIESLGFRVGRSVERRVG